MPMQAEAYPLGEAGIQKSLSKILPIIREGRHDPDLRAFAAQALSKAGLDGREYATLDPVKRAQVILDAIRAQTTYSPDPVNTEWIQKPHVTLCLEKYCIPMGDCDDLTAATGAVLASIGISVYAVRQKFGAGQQEHILIGIIDDSGGKWYIDPSTRDPVYQISKARSEEWISPMDTPSKATGTAGAELVTFGRPGRADPAPNCYDSMFCPIKARAGMGAIVVTPGDVLAYRNMWNAYVVGTAQAATACSAMWAASSPGATAGGINVQQFAVAPDATTFQLWAKAEQGYADSIMAQWNYFAGLSKADIVLRASDILQYFQQVVLQVGQFYQPNIARDCPSIQLPAPPDLSVQAQVIGQIEGLGILGSGVLQILGQTTGQALEAVGNAAGWFKQQTEKVTTAIASPWPFVALTVGALAVLGVVYAPEIKATYGMIPKRKKKA